MNVDGPDLEDRYRRVLRLLPGYYRATWEDDMVAAYLDSQAAGDEDKDEYAFEFGRPAWPEVASVAALAARLYLGGAGSPRQYFAWGQAVRRAVLAVVLVHAVQGLTDLTLLAWHRHRADWLPALPATLAAPMPGGFWPTVANTVDYAWIVIFVLLVFGHHRTARAIAALTMRPALPAGGPVRRPLAEAPRLVEFLLPARPGPGPGHGRLSPGRPAGRSPALAAGGALLLLPSARAGDSAPGDR